MAPSSGYWKSYQCGVSGHRLHTKIRSDPCRPTTTPVGSWSSRMRGSPHSTSRSSTGRHRGAVPPSNSPDAIVNNRSVSPSQAGHGRTNRSLRFHFGHPVGCQFADLRFSGFERPPPRIGAGGRRPWWQGRGSIRTQQKSSSAAVFVDQTTQHVNSLHRRLDDARLDDGWLD